MTRYVFNDPNSTNRMHKYTIACAKCKADISTEAQYSSDVGVLCGECNSVV